MAEITIPIQTSLNIEKFSGATITVASSIATNLIFKEYPEGEVYATQRPGVNTIEDASTAGVDANGRGMYYWEAKSKTYIVNYDTVYIDSYSGTTMSITAGSDKVYFAEDGGYLLLIDPQNDEGWVIDGDADVILQMTGSGTWAGGTGTPTYDFTNFPTDLVDGLVVLNQTAYVMTSAGVIWSHPDVGDPLNWTSALTFITAELDDDVGVYIGRHQNDIFALGSKTIEFFYDAANPTGSNLSTRTDIAHNIGCVDGRSVWTENDITFFIGVTSSGEVGAYKLERYQVEKVSTPPTDSYFTTATKVDMVDILGSGFSSGGSIFYIVTLNEKAGASPFVIQPFDTLVYNRDSGTWSRWEHASADVSEFPVVAFSTNTQTATGKGIFSNGDYFEIYDDYNPVDSIGASLYVVDGYVEGDYITSTSASGDNISVTLRIPHKNDDTGYRKFMDKLWVIADRTSTTQNLSISWSDGNHEDFNTAKTLDLSRESSKISRLGNYRERTYELTYSGDEQIRIRGLRGIVRKGSN